MNAITGICSSLIAKEKVKSNLNRIVELYRKRLNFLKESDSIHLTDKILIKKILCEYRKKLEPTTIIEDADVKDLN